MPDCAKYNDRPVDTGVSFVPCSKLSEGGRQAGRPLCSVSEESLWINC